MWKANFEDGSTISEKTLLWDQLTRDKKMSALSLSHPYLPHLNVALVDYDRYYFTREAIASYGSQQGTIVAEIIGGHDLKLGVAVEVRLEYTGTVKVKSYPVSRFKYSPQILYEGKNNGRAPAVEAT